MRPHALRLAGPGAIAIALAACSTPASVSDDGTAGDDTGTDDGATDGLGSTEGDDGLGATSTDPSGPLPETTGPSATATSGDDTGPSVGDDTTSGAGTSDGGSDDDASGSTGQPAEPADPVATYRVTIHNTWSEANHPGAVPELAHFSWLAGGGHDDTLTVWEVGGLASPGMVQMAEIGVTTELSVEMLAAIDAGQASRAWSFPQWFCPAVTTVEACGTPVVEIQVDAAFSRVTLVTMLGPSPDLFVGVSGMPLLVDGDWLDEVVVDLFPYDGGTRSDVDFTMNGALTVPAEPISTIDDFDDHLIGPASLGTMTFQRIVPSS